MDQGIEFKGCVSRIKNCASELLSMEEDLVIDRDDDSWDLLWRDLRLKATFLYIDLSRVISCTESDEPKKVLTLLANKFFYSMDEIQQSLNVDAVTEFWQLGDAVMSRSFSVMKVCYNDTAKALHEMIAAIAPSQ